MRTLVHVGLHKTATSWLQERVFPATGGLANNTGEPWKDPIIRSLVLGDAPPPELPDDKWIISAERLGGHPSSGWIDGDSIAQRIKRAYPDAKILVGVREESTWLRSVYKQLVLAGETRTFEAMTGDNLNGWKQGSLDAKRVCPAALEERYGSLFDSVLLLPFELLVEDPDAYLSELARFMGVAPPVVDTSPVNTGSSRHLELRRRLNHFRASPLNPDPVVDATRFTVRLQHWLM